MERTAVVALQAAINTVRDRARSGGLDGCDLDDLEEIILPAMTELSYARPNLHTLSTYLTSLAPCLSPGPRAFPYRFPAGPSV